MPSRALDRGQSLARNCPSTTHQRCGMLELLVAGQSLSTTVRIARDGGLLSEGPVQEGVTQMIGESQTLSLRAP